MITLRNHAPQSYITWLPVTLTWLLVVLTWLHLEIMHRGHTWHDYPWHWHDYPWPWVSLTWLLYNLQVWRHRRWFRKFTVRLQPIRKEIASSMYGMVAVLLGSCKAPRNDEIALQHFFSCLQQCKIFSYFICAACNFFFQQAFAGNFFSKSPTPLPP